MRSISLNKEMAEYHLRPHFASCTHHVFFLSVGYQQPNCITSDWVLCDYCTHVTDVRSSSYVIDHKEDLINILQIWNGSKCVGCSPPDTSLMIKRILSDSRTSDFCCIFCCFVSKACVCRCAVYVCISSIHLISCGEGLYPVTNEPMCSIT